MRTFLALGLAMACLWLAVPAAAQETRGAIEGVVKDSTGGVLPGVTVEATIAGGAVQATVSDAKGIYRFPALPPGTYTVKATLAGFTAARAEGVKVVLGQLLTVGLTMSPGVSETIEVSARAPVVDVRQSAVTHVITSDIIDLIPKSGTGILGALSGLPGAGNETRGGGIMIDGAGASENRYIIDGMDASDLRSGVLGKDLSINFIDQLQVKSSGYNAEYRAATGGVISAVTKSGTNAYHGALGTFLSGRPLRGLSGSVRPQWRLVATDSTRAESFYTPRLNETTTTNSDVSIGGPVFANHLWFFAGYNPAVTKQVRNVIWTTPASYAGLKQTFDAKRNDPSYVYNVTTQVAKNMRFRFNGANERTSGMLALPTIDSNTGTSTSNATTFNPRASTYTASFNDSFSGVLDWTLDNKTYVNITTGLLSYGSHTAGGDYYHGIKRTFSGSNVGYLDVPVALQGVSGFTDNLSNSFSVKDNYTRYNFNADVTRFVSWRGQHSIKAGTQLERFGNDVDTGAQFPNVTINWNGTRATLGNLQVRGTYGYYSVLQSYTIGNIHSTNIGIYGQDAWTVNPKLTINYGLRVDNTNIPSYRPENQGINFSFREKMAPRLGFAYDLTGNGKWKAYGSWGVFYDIEKLEMPRGSFGAEHSVTYYWTLDNYNWPAINCDGTPNSGCPGTYIEQNDLRHVSNGTGSDNLVDPNLKPYKSEELTFGLDHELGRRMSVGMRFTHKWIDMAIEDVGVNVPGVGEVFFTANPGYGYGEFPLKNESSEFPATPKPKRHYDGMEFTFNRRLSNRWLLNSSLLLSRTWGSYGGLTSSDENGRNSPGVNRYYDGLSMSFDQNGKPVFGLLPSDRLYVVKIQPGYLLPWGTQAGAEIDFMSGQPQSTTVTYKAVPVFVYGRNDLGRSAALSYVNLNFQQAFRLRGGRSVTASLNLDNLFDQMTITAVTQTAYRDTLTFPQCSSGTATQNTLCADRVFFAGFSTPAAMAADQAANINTGRPNALYGLPTSSGYQSARSARFQVKFSF